MNTESSDEADREDQRFDHSLLDMPTTAYLVLGLLSLLGEGLTAGEIESRAEHTLGRFYWSPSVSHIRRELDRLTAHCLTTETSEKLGRRTRSIYASTPLGDAVVKQWAISLPEGDLVIKHPMMLRVFLASDTGPDVVLPIIDDYLARLETKIQESHWAARRGRETGNEFEPSSRRYPWMIDAYTHRALYAELANVRQLRDDIEWRFSSHYPAGDTSRPPGGRPSSKRDSARPPAND